MPRIYKLMRPSFSFSFKNNTLTETIFMGFFLYFEILNRIILDLLIHEYRVHKKEKIQVPMNTFSYLII